MKKESLLDKRDAVEKRFNELVTQKSEIDQELNRLQGEYRGYTALIDEQEPKVKETEK